MFKKIKFSSVSSLFLLVLSVSIFPISVYYMVNSNCVLLDWSLFSLSSCSMSMMIVLDKVSLSFSGVVNLISGCVMMFSSSYMAEDKNINRFTAIVLLFVMSMNFLIFIPSVPALLLGWDGLGIVSFALVIYYQNVKSLSAGFLTLLVNRIGDVMILICVGLLVIQGHWVVTLMWDFKFSGFVILSLVIASMTKSAQIPFSAWLPAAMAAPTPVSALVHSSTLVTAGVYLIIRFHPFLSSIDAFNFWLFLVSVLTLLMAGVGASFENDLKKVIALSTLSQLGVMMLSLSMDMVGLALFHLYTHALFKALLFLCAGAIIHGCSNNQDLRYMGMMGAQMPFTVCCMNIANLSLCGAPFLSGFYSKDLILQTCLMSPSSFVMILLVFIATGFTLAYSMRLSFFCLWGPYTGFPMHSKHEFDWYINISSGVLATLAVVSGLLLQLLFIDFEVSLIIIPGMIKGGCMSIVGLGVIVGYFLCWGSPSEKKINKAEEFASTMWFLAPLSCQPLAKSLMLSSSNLLKSVDQGWLEVLGGAGAFYSVATASQINQSFQMKSFNVLVGATLVAGVLMIFWVLYS